MSTVQKLAQTPLLNRLFRAPRTAIQPLLDLVRHDGMGDARTLDFHSEMGGRSRCTFVVAKRFQGEYSGLIERLGSDLDGVLNSIGIVEETVHVFRVPTDGRIAYSSFVRLRIGAVRTRELPVSNVLKY